MWLLSLKDPREKLARWVVEVQDFEFTIEHRSGPELVVPDALSRDAMPKPLCQSCYGAMDRVCRGEICHDEERESVAVLNEAVSITAGQVEALGDGPTEGELGTAQISEFGDLTTYVRGRRNLLVDNVGLLRSTKRDELPVVVPAALVKDVLSFVHGSSLSGHYKLQRTTVKLVTRFWWKTMARDTAFFIRDYLQCAVAEDRQPGRQALLEIIHPLCRL